MTDIVPHKGVEHKNKWVLTSEQLAEAYGTTSDSLLRNFRRNKSKFTEEKHYFYLTGDTLQLFVADNLSATKTREMYLWTEKGALLLAKSLGTDKAWEASEKLVDEYFRQKTQIEKYERMIAIHEAEKAKMIPTSKAEELEMLLIRFRQIAQQKHLPVPELLEEAIMFMRQHHHTITQFDQKLIELYNR